MKTLFIVSFLIVSLVHSNAQYQKFYLQASYDQVLFPFHNYDFHKNGFSYRVGGVVGLFITKHVAVASGINFESKNYSIKYPPRDSPANQLVEEEYYFSYISFPLILEVDILNSKSHSLLINTGFELDRLLEYDYQKLYSDGSYINGSNEYRVLQNNMSFLIGPAYRYFFKNNVFLGFNPRFRYNLSSHGITTGETTRASFVFQFSSGYSF